MTPTFSKFLTEGAGLTPGELYKYAWRVDLFVQKYKDREPFQLKKGGTVVLNYDPAVADRIAKKQLPNKIRVVDNNNREYRLGDFAKTKEFGGGGGSGAGADITKLAEAAQCVYCAAKWNGSKTFNTDDLEAAVNMTDTDEDKSNIIYNLDDSWRASSILGANALFKLYGRKKYVFHRGSSWVDRLEKKFKELNRKEKAFSNLNKWTPADIWLVSPKGQTIRFDEAKSVTELNSMLMTAMKSKDIVGVSLKKMKGSAHAEYYNVDAKRKIIKFSKYTTGTKGFFKGKDIYLFFSVGSKIQFRTFPQTFQGEIKGKNANMGKFSYGPMQGILRNLGMRQLHDIRVLRKALANPDDKIYQIFYENYSRYADVSNNLSFDDFMDEVNVKGNDWAFSKFLGCELIDIIVSTGNEDEFISAAIGYASSASDLSAPFLKIA